MSYNSKYSGQQVEDLLDLIPNKQDKIDDLDAIRAGAGKGATALQSVPSEYVTETELSSKSYATTTQLSYKVDKVTGKGLSTEDFTTALKTKLEGLNNYDDANLESTISLLREDFDALVSGDTTTAIKTFNEIVAFLEGISDTESLDSIIASIEQQIAAKQDKITDLDTIRANAAKGATALQEEQYKGTYSKPSTGIPKTDLATAVQTSLGKADTALQQHQDISGKLDKTEAASTYLTKTDAASTYLGKTAKAASATSADSATKATQDGSGNVIISTYATKTELNGKGTYSKPSGGIPSSDLSSDVQSALTKANSALQSETYKGTVTGVKINGTTKNPSSGIVDLGTVITAHQDISGKQDKLVSGTNIKTINGTSILGSGNITIEGGGSSSGEDIRYFTEFTVEDFIEGCKTASPITYDTTELFNAMKSNKVICVPYRGYDKGFIVASYQSGEDEEYPSMYLQKGGVEYYALTGDSYELSGEYPTYSSVQVVEMAGGEVQFEVLDNHIYRINDPVDYLFIATYNVQKGTTIHFISGEAGTTIGVMDMIYWANGEIPQIEPNTCYELSLMQNTTYGYNAVLTKFKLVE